MFVLFKPKDHLLLFTRYMNTRDKNFKFTRDFEQNNSLSFLDALRSPVEIKDLRSSHSSSSFMPVLLEPKI